MLHSYSGSRELTLQIAVINIARPQNISKEKIIQIKLNLLFFPSNSCLLCEDTSNTEKFICIQLKLHVTNNNGMGIFCAYITIYNKTFSTPIVPGKVFKNILTKECIMELWEIRS